MIFGLFRRKAKSKPQLVASAIEPGVEPFNLAQAKRYYKKYMLNQGFFDSRDASQNVEYFSESYRESIEYAKSKITDLKSELREIKKDGDKEEIDICQNEILRCEFIYQWYKNEKRKYLAEYINIELNESNPGYPIEIASECGVPVEPVEIYTRYYKSEDGQSLLVRSVSEFTFEAQDLKSGKVENYRYSRSNDSTHLDVRVHAKL